uniref:Uncharacterized protein n=1 Tax=Leersia perrieri TaxID=77586 RepID=A0A0D9XJQ5_9ORYZ
MELEPRDTAPMVTLLLKPVASCEEAGRSSTSKDAINTGNANLVLNSDHRNIIGVHAASNPLDLICYTTKPVSLP